LWCLIVGKSEEAEIVFGTEVEVRTLHAQIKNAGSRCWKPGTETSGLDVIASFQWDDGELIDEATVDGEDW